MKTLVIIPSRMSATRLPGKPLLKINNISIISTVYKKAVEADIGDVIVAGNGADIIQPGAGADYVHGGLNNNSGGGGNNSWFRDEANFWDAPYSRTEVQQVKVMVNADTGLMTHTNEDQFIVYGYTGEAARVEDYEEDVSINDTVKTYNSSTIISTGADPESIATGTDTT